MDSSKISSTSSLPKALSHGSFSLLATARGFYDGFLKSHSEADSEEALKHVEQELQTLLGEGYEEITQAIVEHIKLYPKEPQGGFNSIEEYKKYLQSNNKIFSAEYKLYSLQRESLGCEDDLDASPHQNHILTECADGRNSLMIFLPENKLLSRFSIEWLPIAGAMLAPDSQLSTQGVTQPEGYKQILEKAPDLKSELFERFEMLYGPKIEEALSDYKQGRITNLSLEFQAHFDKSNDHHGCGAHGSNLLNTQLETIKDCLLMERYLREKYPQEYAAGFFKVFRTIHDTGEGKPIYSARYIDGLISPESKEKYHALFEYAARHFEDPILADAGKGIVRLHQKNEVGINEEEHDEQTVRISNLHLAHTLLEQSAMEISWFEDPQLVFNHLKVLLGIIGKYYGKHHLDKPFFVHFDLVKGNEKMRKVYQGVRDLMAKDEQIKAFVADRKVQLLVTETDRKTFETSVVEA